MSVTEHDDTADETAAWDRARGDDATAYTVRKGDRIVAGCCVTNGFISGLRVDEDMRRMGLATTILNMAKANHASLALVCTDELLPFYTKRGFVRIGPYCPNGNAMRWDRPQ